jgi:hypothetical protein
MGRAGFDFAAAWSGRVGCISAGRPSVDAEPGPEPVDVPLHLDPAVPGRHAERDKNLLREAVQLQLEPVEQVGAAVEAGAWSRDIGGRPPRSRSWGRSCRYSSGRHPPRYRD